MTITTRLSALALVALAVTSCGGPAAEPSRTTRTTATPETTSYDPPGGTRTAPAPTKTLSLEKADACSLPRPDDLRAAGLVGDIATKATGSSCRFSVKGAETSLALHLFPDAETPSPLGAAYELRRGEEGFRSLVIAGMPAASYAIGGDGCVVVADTAKGRGLKLVVSHASCDASARVVEGVLRALGA